VRTTQPPSHSVADAIPELADRARTTVRLHPRQEAEPPPDMSKLGGGVRWPAGERWPRCDLAHQLWDSLQTEEPPDDRAYVPVLQLRRADVPELEFPPGTDVFQLLWCPSDHAGPLYVPVVRVFWWDASDLVDTIVPSPTPTTAPSNYIPRPCGLHPERVDEYPGIGELPRPLQEKIWAWGDAQGQSPLYQYLLSTAPGTKVGGYPNWFQDPQPQTCAAGHPMDHLVTISDTEFDGGTWPRWLAVEEADVWSGPTGQRLAVQGAAGIDLGMGSVYVFICRMCPDRPIRQVYQR
jgi:hypothetical protein